MHWALKNGERTTAQPGLRAQCPGCRGEVLAKCGSIVVWHWAHLADDCDTWNEPESAWHLGWKQRFPDDWQEVVLGNHRADVKTPKLVVELQASSISPEEIQARERHYRNMVWLLRGGDFEDNLCIRQRDGYLSFRWKWPRKSWWSAKMPIVIDTRAGLLYVRKLHHETPCGGWGIWISENEFLGRCGLK
jgi:competence protein CoiA